LTVRVRQASAGATASPERSRSAPTRRVQVMGLGIPKRRATRPGFPDPHQIGQNMGPPRPRPVAGARRVFGSGQLRVVHGQRASPRNRLARMETWIGTSGYNYPEWKGHFYPADLPASKMLPFSALK